MTQKLKQSRLQRLFNNVLSKKEAALWITALLTIGYVCGKYLF